LRALTATDAQVEGKRRQAILKQQESTTTIMRTRGDFQRGEKTARERYSETHQRTTSLDREEGSRAINVDTERGRGKRPNS
jgi:hypothetical protein